MQTPVSSEEDHPTKLEDLQGFWEMVQIQIDDVYDMFAEIDLLRQNGWKEVHFEVSYHKSCISKSTHSVIHAFVFFTWYEE